MDSKDDPNADGQRPITVTENSDTAVQKKKARRVSFAETTSIRLFSRDEESDETPLMKTANIKDDSPGEFKVGHLPDMEFGSLYGANENDDDEEVDMRMTFLRPIRSPSPGGSTFGSASSNDEDNFFGPVSADFIKPGRLSDSAASDDNHDQTMDSTAFSMHYRSLARSESGLDLKTPTEGKLFFDEKIPASGNTGIPMTFTLGKKVIPISCIPATEVSGGQTSNDMSLVEENKYDFFKLSPRLDAVLAESGKDLFLDTVSDHNITSSSPNGDNPVSQSDHLLLETAFSNSLVVRSEGESAHHINPGEANALHGIFPSATSPEQPYNSFGGASPNKDNDKLIKSPYQLSKNGYETPLASASSPVKRQQIILTVASPSKSRELSSPLPQPGSMLRNVSVGQQETETSIQKSISKLELLERSALSSAFSAKSDNSFVKTLDFFKSPNFDPLLGKTRHISKINFLEDSVTEEKLSSVHQSRERGYASSMDCGRAEILNPNSGENNMEEQLGQKVRGKLPNHLTDENISRDQAKYVETVSSPSKITLVGINSMCDLFTSKHSNEDTLMTETESLLTEFASGDGGKSILSPFSSPHRRAGKKLSALPDPQSTRAIDLYVQSPLKQLPGLYKDTDYTPGRMFSVANLSNATGKRGVISKGIKGELSSPIVDASSPNKLIEIQAIDNGENDICRSKEKKSQTLHSKNMDVGNLVRRDMSGFEDSLHGSDPVAGFNGSIYPSDRGNLDELRLQSLVELSTTSPSREKLSIEQSHGMLSPRNTRPENISASKRNVDLLLRDTEHQNEMTLMQRSHKLLKGGSSDQETALHPNEDGSLIVHERQKWTDIYSKFSEDMKGLVPRSADNLSIKMIDALKDVLAHQQRSKVYELLHHGVMTQNSVVNEVQHEKMAETISLLHQVVFEKAKLQLNHIKKGKLMKKSQQLNSRLQEAQEWGEKIASQTLQTRTTNVVTDAGCNQTISVNLKKGNEDSHEKVTAMRQDIDTLDRKISELMTTFHARCKIKPETSCADTIALVNEHLLKRASCRSARLKMQTWVVESIGGVDGHRSVILNYLDFVIQSIKIIGRPASSVSSSFKLNEANILKSYPNMDAGVAFGFVFNSENPHGAKTLPQETQVTSSLFGNLLDVVEEVQLAQIELRNLIQSRFCSPSVERLDLTLCFFNFTSGRKVNLTLDMSCLKRGIYPSEVVPLFKEQSSSSSMNFDVIEEAVKGVQTGYTRVLRMCKCVAQVVRASAA